MKKQTHSASPSQAIAELNRLAFEAKKARYSNAPVYGIPVPKFSDKTVNDLQKAIIAYIRLLGGYAARINVQGQYREDLGKWTKSGSTIGTADIIGCLHGKFLSVEVKYGNDKMSEAQRETEQQVIAAGGYYQAVSTFQECFDWLNQIQEDRK